MHNTAQATFEVVQQAKGRSLAGLKGQLKGENMKKLKRYWKLVVV